ncbi:(Fe-S)-binding protein, partial [Dissulfurirhabdus thermomarina]
LPGGGGWGFPAPAALPATGRPELRPLCPGAGPVRAALFVGCLQEHFFPEVAVAVARWFGEGDLAVPAGQGCCGLPAWAAGDVAGARDQARRFVRVFAPLHATWVVTGCASCAAFLSRRLPGLFPPGDPDGEAAAALAARVREFARLVLELGLRPAGAPGTPPPAAVTWHTPCHQRHGLGDPSVLPEFLEALGGMDLRPAGEGCCGQGGAFAFREPGTAEALLAARRSDFRAAGAEVVVTNCSGCLLRLRA